LEKVGQPIAVDIYEEGPRVDAVVVHQGNRELLVEQFPLLGDGLSLVILDCERAQEVLATRGVGEAEGGEEASARVFTEGVIELVSEEGGAGRFDMDSAEAAGPGFKATRGRGDQRVRPGLPFELHLVGGAVVGKRAGVFDGCGIDRAGTHLEITDGVGRTLLVGDEDPGVMGRPDFREVLNVAVEITDRGKGVTIALRVPSLPVGEGVRGRRGLDLPVGLGARREGAPSLVFQLLRHTPDVDEETVGVPARGGKERGWSIRFRGNGIAATAASF
jgi:hypothetical protein